MVAKEYTDEASGNIIIGAIQKILKMLDENRFPFIARIGESGSVRLWRTEPIRRKGFKRKRPLQMKKANPTKPPSEEYQRFEQFVKELVAVPKSELDKREAAYQRKKLAEKKRKAA